MEDPNDESAIRRRAAFVQAMKEPAAVLPPPPPPSCHDICAICREEVVIVVGSNNDDVARLNNCTHTYHWDCIEEWAKRQTTCPLCTAAFDSINGVAVARRRLAPERMAQRLRGM
jgi:nitrite reductase/ring-hydroxylating ferredoxin subunit